jgi:hypothetical protein
VQQWLHEHCDQIEVFWLLPYSSSLNLIERLWGHIKRTIRVNDFFASLDDLVAAFCHGARQLTGDRSRMNFIFDHDDLIPPEQRMNRTKTA